MTLEGAAGGGVAIFLACIISFFDTILSLIVSFLELSVKIRATILLAENKWPLFEKAYFEFELFEFRQF